MSYSLMSMKKGLIFLVLAVAVLIFAFKADNVFAYTCGNYVCESGEADINANPVVNNCPEDCKCGNGICEAGEGELEFCPVDCEGKFISSPGEDCRAGACTSVDSTSRCSGTGSNFICDCIFSVATGCFTCPKSGGNSWYSAWGDYACRLQGHINDCNTALAPPTIADFYVNSCDGSEGCCGSGQSSCIKECGQKDANGLIKAKGPDGVLGTSDDVFYGGGALGVCREDCNPSTDTCRTQANGQAQRCVSCSYRADSLWISEFGNAGLWSTANVKNGVWIDDPGCVQNVKLNCDITDNNCLKSSGNFNCPSESKDSLITLTYSGNAAKPVVSKLTTNDVNNPSQRQCSNFDAFNGECKDSFTAQGVNGFTLDTDLSVAGYSGAANTLSGNCNFYFGCALGQKWDYTKKSCVDDVKGCVTQLNGNCGSFDAGTSIEVTNKNNCVSPEKCLQCKQGYVWNVDLKKCVAPCDGSSTSVLAGRQGGCTILALTTSDIANDLITTANQCQNSRRCVACKTGYVWKGIESTNEGCLPNCGQQEQSCTSNADCCQFNADNPPKELYCSKGLDGQSSRGSCCPKGKYFDVRIGACRDPNICVDKCPIGIKLLSGLFNPLFFSSEYFDKCLIETPKPFEEACVENRNLGTPLKVYQKIHVLDVNKNRVT